MISNDTQIKLAIVSFKLIGQWVPLDTLSEDLRDGFGVQLSSRQIAAIYRYWRECNKKFTFDETGEEKVGIKKKRLVRSDAGYARVSSVYKTDAKTIKRLLDFLYRRHLLDKNSSE